MTGFIMLAATVLMPGSAAATDAAADSTVHFSEKIYFRKSSARIDSAFGGNAAALERIREFAADADSLAGLRIEVVGSASPEGTHEFNLGLARRRADALIGRLGPAAAGAPVASHGVVGPADSVAATWPALRFAALTASWTVAPVVPAADEGTKFPAEDGEQTSAAAILPPAPHAPAAAVAPERRTGVRFFVSTNLLYDAAITPNVGAGVCFGDRFTVYADWMYAWWCNRPERFYWRVYGGDIELRRQFGHGRSSNPLSGHRVGVYASIVTYDFQFGRSHTGVIGDKFNYAVGVSYGYSLPLTRRLSLDFSLGVGYMWGRYMKQHLIDTHDVWQSTHTRRWFGPTRAEVSLVWLLGRDNVNSPRRQKGGGR